MILRVLSFLCVLISLPVVAQVREITLPADTSRLQESSLPGYAIAQQKCGICHSADYVHFQPPGMGLTQWTAEMTKMQHSYGAPISPEEIEQLGAYLAVTYGSAKATDPEVVALIESAAESVPAATGSTGDAAVQALLAGNACLGCHAIDQKLVGPSFTDVAGRYKGQADALATLAASIRNGGSGKWGSMAMPPMAALSDADAEALARFILSQ